MTSFMQKEAAQTPQLIGHQWQKNHHILSELSQRLRQSPPSFAMTIGRGSSDNAATFAKYLLETYQGLVTSSAAPSVLTIYGKQLNVKNSLVIGISQSGKSPDICEMMLSARQAGAITAAFVNKVDSPMAAAAEYVIPLWAGEEHAVAATKTYLTSLSALIQFIAYYDNDQQLIDCGKQLPEYLTLNLKSDTDEIIETLKPVQQLLVLGRGYGFPVAQEIALKLKETMAMYAEAISSAEVLHGPFALINQDQPVLMLAQADVSLPSVINLGQQMKKLGAKVVLTIPHDKLPDSSAYSQCLSLPRSLHPVCDPLLSAQALYPMIARLALLRGYNPDQPEKLKKVTETR